MADPNVIIDLSDDGDLAEGTSLGAGTDGPLMTLDLFDVRLILTLDQFRALAGFLCAYPMPDVVPTGGVLAAGDGDVTAEVLDEMAGGATAGGLAEFGPLVVFEAADGGVLVAGKAGVSLGFVLPTAGAVGETAVAETCLSGV